MVRRLLLRNAGITAPIWRASHTGHGFHPAQITVDAVDLTLNFLRRNLATDQLCVHVFQIIVELDETLADRLGKSVAIHRRFVGAKPMIEAIHLPFQTAKDLGFDIHRGRTQPR